MWVRQHCQHLEMLSFGESLAAAIAAAQMRLLLLQVPLAGRDLLLVSPVQRAGLSTAGIVACLHTQEAVRSTTWALQGMADMLRLCG